MVRAPCFDKNGMKKGAWSEDEDNKLRAYIQRYGHSNWRLLPKFAGLSRCGKSCRLRWMNYLRPNIKRGQFTKEEEDIVLQLHSKIGNKWSAMATELPGRSDNEIKNYWHTHLKKRAQKNQTEFKDELAGTPDSDQENPVGKSDRREVEILSAVLSSKSPSSSVDLSSVSLNGSNCSVLSDVSRPPSDYELAGNFWTELFPSENDIIISPGVDLWSNLDLVNGSITRDLNMGDDFLWSTNDLYPRYGSHSVS